MQRSLGHGTLAGTGIADHMAQLLDLLLQEEVSEGCVEDWIKEEVLRKVSMQGQRKLMET